MLGELRAGVRLAPRAGVRGGELCGLGSGQRHVDRGELEISKPRHPSRHALTGATTRVPQAARDRVDLRSSTRVATRREGDAVSPTAERAPRARLHAWRSASAAQLDRCKLKVPQETNLGRGVLPVPGRLHPEKVRTGVSAPYPPVALCGDLRSTDSVGSALSRRLGMPAATPLLDLALLLQGRENLVEVGPVDTNLLCQLGDGDARLSPHERQGLRGAGAAAFGPSGARTFRDGGRGRGFGGAASRASYLFGPTNFFGASRFFGPSRGATRFFGGSRRSSSGGGSRSAHLGECRSGVLEAIVLVHRGLQLLQSIGDLFALVVKKVGQS